MRVIIQVTDGISDRGFAGYGCRIGKGAGINIGLCQRIGAGKGAVVRGKWSKVDGSAADRYAANQVGNSNIIQGYFTGIGYGKDVINYIPGVGYCAAAGYGHIQRTGFFQLNGRCLRNHFFRIAHRIGLVAVRIGGVGETAVG